MRIAAVIPLLDEEPTLHELHAPPIFVLQQAAYGAGFLAGLWRSRGERSR